jgi:hypothetical protein
MSVQINSNSPVNSLAEARRLRDSLRQQIKTPGYEEQKRQKIRSAIHDEANHMVNGYVKSPWQIAFLEATPPMVIKRGGRMFYDQRKTLSHLRKLISSIVDDEHSDSLRAYEKGQLIQLKPFLLESAKLRIQRNKDMMFREDPQKNGHDIARKFAIDRYNVFEEFFPDKNVKKVLKFDD